MVRQTLDGISEVKRWHGLRSTSGKRRGADAPGYDRMAYCVANRCRTSCTIEKRGGAFCRPPLSSSFLFTSSTLCRRLHFGGRGVLLAVWIRAEVLFNP